MPKKFYAYVTSKNLGNLWRKVNALVDDGFEPFESVFTTDDNSYAQAMMKEIPDDMSALKHWDERDEHYNDMFEEEEEDNDDDVEGDNLSGDDLTVIDTNPQPKGFSDSDSSIGLIDDILRQKNVVENKNEERYIIFCKKQMPEEHAQLMDYCIDCYEVQKLFENGTTQWLKLETLKMEAEEKLKELD